ncbi:hypothetical protein EGW08_011928 [Elysia chlorotica]|uniref:Major facilitator superfamily (MFS) profile domain-containing protein n=1 Tax=Elysia chlorotica TaxID=188477 RepID=A0A3S1BBQ8_ELYCH|nr:hypothetical protein EGW08_011928 [Elysia chlorotica]
MSADSHHACYSQSSGRGESTLMQVVQTHVGGHLFNALFDSGSDFSYIREDAAKRLKLVKVGSQCTTIAAFGGTIHKDHQHQVFGLNIGGSGFVMALERIFDQIGGFSRFQWLMIAWVYTFKFMIGWSTMILSFASYKNDHACIVDGVLNGSELQYLNASQVWQIAEQGINNQTLINVCKVDDRSCESFYFFGVRRTIVSEGQEEAARAEIKPASVETACSTHTTPPPLWSLVCDLRWMKATITSIQFGGVLTGAVFAGHSGDYFGRKKTLYVTYLLHTLLNVVAAFCVTWQMFAVMRFLIGIMIGAVLVVIVPYSTEFFPTQWRHILPPLPMWPLGVIAFAGGAWLLEDWSDLHLVCAALTVPGLLGYFYLPESARWLATQGREEEALDALQKMARVNRKELPPSAMDTIKKIANEEKTTRKGKDYSYLDLFKGKETAKVTIIAGFQWFVLSTVFYGLSFGVASFAGNLYLNIFLMSAVTLPSSLLSFLLISSPRTPGQDADLLPVSDRQARGGCLLDRISDLGHGELPNGHQVASSIPTISPRTPGQDADLLPVSDRQARGGCLLDRISDLGHGELPNGHQTRSDITPPVETKMVSLSKTRSLGYGFANTTSRVGAVLAPFVMNLDEMPLFAYILMGTLTLVSTISTCFLPETRNKVMAETVQEKRWLENGVTRDFDGDTDIPLTAAKN